MEKGKSWPDWLKSKNKKKIDKIPAQLEKSTKTHAKQAKDLRAAGIGEQIDDLFSNYEVPKPAVSIPAPQKVRLPQQQPSRRDSLIENAAKAISHVAKKDAKVETKPLRESGSLEDRIRLLEQDLFRVQAQATPNTLVAGIGASLDSGGGAVWLWDLEDVDIGVPVNGQYPPVSDGQALVYDASKEQWVPGAGGGGTPITDITAQFLEFDGDQTAQGIRVTGAADKEFVINVGETTGSATTVAEFAPGKLTLPSGELAANTVTATNAHFSGQIVTNEENVTTLLGARQGVVYKLIAGTGLTFEGQLSTHIGGTVGNEYNTNVGTIGVGPTVLQTTGDQIITGNKTYTGSTDDVRSLQTKQSVQNLIAAGGGGLDFNFMGTTDVTTANPPVGSEVVGNYFSNKPVNTFIITIFNCISKRRKPRTIFMHK